MEFPSLLELTMLGFILSMMVAGFLLNPWWFGMALFAICLWAIGKVVQHDMNR
jgi:hypothetical protein